MKHPHTSLTRTLESVRMSLLRLHKKLLEAERHRYERENGRIENGSALLQLVINDPFFSWLRKLSELVVEIDERLEGETPMSDADVRVMLDQIGTMLQPSTRGDAFQQNYDRVMQGDPDVVIAHVELTRVLDAEQRSR
ncbi:MAG TPA: hypothetical protein VGM67_08515 [Gemmatimonadaceae bacterium]|jgi:hypothetical protein